MHGIIDERPTEPLKTKWFHGSVPQLALVCMLIGIMGPPLSDSLGFKELTPTQVITSVCIALFSSILYLWILDATSVFRFRSAWVSRSVYTLGIAAIISASVGIYKGAFTDHLHPFDGEWRLSAWDGTGERVADGQELVLYYNKSAQAYSGYSSFVASALEGSRLIRHVRIERFDPQSNALNMTVLRQSHGSEQITGGSIAKDGSKFEFVSGTPQTLGAVRYVFTRR